MAQKRMLNKSISTSIQVDNLDLKQRLIFTWIIPHLDDHGLIDKIPKLIKALVFPMAKDITEKDIESFIKGAEKEGLIKVYDDCLEYPGFDNHQTISEAKKARSKFKKYINPQESPKFPKNFPNKELSKGTKERNGGNKNIGEISQIDKVRQKLIKDKIIK